MSEHDSPSKKSTIDRSFRLPAPFRTVAAVLGRTAPGLATRAAETLFLRPPRFNRPRREWRWLDDAEPLRFRYDRHELTGWSWGTGPTILLVHGWAGRGSQMGAYAKPLVDRGYRVVTFDGPGHGASPGRRSSLPEFAEAISAVGENLWPLRGIIAHSFGTAATTVALSRGLVADRLVYVAPPADLSFFTRGFASAVGFPAPIARGLEERLEKRFDFRWAELQPTVLARSIAARPLLVIHDLDDGEVPHQQAVDLVAAWPGARLETTRRLGHRVILRYPTAVAAAVDFVAESRAREEPAAGAVDRWSRFVPAAART